jgi:hypothetical protein
MARSAMAHKLVMH